MEKTVSLNNIFNNYCTNAVAEKLAPIDKLPPKGSEQCYRLRKSKDQILWW